MTDTDNTAVDKEVVDGYIVAFLLQDNDELYDDTQTFKALTFGYDVSSPFKDAIPRIFLSRKLAEQHCAYMRDASPDTQYIVLPFVFADFTNFYGLPNDQ